MDLGSRTGSGFPEEYAVRRRRTPVHTTVLVIMNAMINFLSLSR